ncbi:ABC transporter permease subunit [Jeotgalibacillus sp. ET6]|uniref:ABC transporter permease n=1 Tax=Jeotgalibacillus sp. ET6 TaxID=3037260 RepID=UPI0024187D8A|nr:ABC transporter permease subunit [Jeotgalibacillus sp. ET6]MDG5470909.1 ABC transporter permease subunit [Jeotgalibacillus sp. ET6]
MGNLIRNEWMKILHRPGTYVMAGLLILAVIASAVITLFINSNFNSSNEDWRQALEAENEQIQMTIESGEEGFYTPSPEGALALNEYRLENDIAPNNAESMWQYLENNSFMISLVGLFSIIVASGIVAGEFSWGTVKLLMIRPIARWKILLSKFLTVATFGLSLIGILTVLSLILGAIFFDSGSAVQLTYSDGEVRESNMIFYLMKVYLYNSIDVILLTTMAFMISAVFRSSSLAIGISLFLYFVGGTATGFIAMYYDWAKYSLFANTNLTMYEMGVPLVEGMTMTFSIIMILIYFTIFVALAFTVFTKRDIAA